MILIEIRHKTLAAKAIDHLRKRWTTFTRFLDDGRIRLSNDAVEHAIRPIAAGRRNWTFAGSDMGDHRAAALSTLIETVEPNRVDPQARLADMLGRLPDHPARRIGDLFAVELDPASTPPHRRLTPQRNNGRGIRRRHTAGVTRGS